MKTNAELNRRRLLHAGLALPLAAEAASAAKPTATESVYKKLGVPTFINAYGTLTTLGGTLMEPEVKRAMDDAAQHFVAIHDLQKRVGERLAELTGAESGFVTAGASCSICLATCAVTVGGNLTKIKRLPDLTGSKSEIVMQKAHTGVGNPYDHNWRMIGTKVIAAETAEEVRGAIGPQTAALGMVLSHNSEGHKLELGEMIAIAHGAGLPLILDAAAEIPPASNLKKFVKMGADLVAFSGGKNLRGPQCSGLLLGRKDLVEAAYANSAPHNLFARIAKVGKEEIVGLLTAVELALKRDDEVERRKQEAMLKRVAERVANVPTVKTEFITNLDYSHSPRLSIQWDETKLGMTAADVNQRLKAGEPSIVAADMTKFRPSWPGLGIFAACLKAGEEIVVAERVRTILMGKG
ncbi:MAG TPA: aminotransferase class V-fold PLP-dependent enzyme [Bryobacteraceae bacterium]|nr:aminotransferase class V-fold PLP-dependent enzyme [Bryobacteraceae bacterium]